MIIVLNIKDIAEDVGSYLIAKYEDSCSSTTIDKECYEAVAGIKADIYDTTVEYLEKENFKIY